MISDTYIDITFFTLGGKRGRKLYPACPDTFIPDMSHAALFVFQYNKRQITQVYTRADIQTLVQLSGLKVCTIK